MKTCDSFVEKNFHGNKRKLPFNSGSQLITRKRTLKFEIWMELLKKKSRNLETKILNHMKIQKFGDLDPNSKLCLQDNSHNNLNKTIKIKIQTIKTKSLPN